MSAIAIILAAGTGRRMGGETPKLFLPLGGRPILSYTLEAFEKAEQVRAVVVVTHESMSDACQKGIVERFGLRKVTDLIVGGAERQDSVRAGLHAVRGRADIVVVHDGDRPFVTPDLIDNSVEMCKESEGAVTAVPLTDTVKVAKAGRVIETLDRTRLWAAQTPQTFPFDLLWEAHEKARSERIKGTDEASLVERLGHSPTLIEGLQENIKITTPGDLLLAETILKNREGKGRRLRVGHGYDIHRLVEGRRMVLGGVEIPFEKGLLGHSDADVLCHAVADALLGALGLGDIGVHFPDSDPRYKDLSSLVLLKRVADKLAKASAKIENIDATLVAEHPKIAPYADRMRQNIGRTLDLSMDRVSIKATTNEGMGALGREEGMAAWAIALVES